MTLDDYELKILRPTIERLAEQLAVELDQPNAFRDGYAPLRLHHRIFNKILYLRENLANAWRCLRGDYSWTDRY